MSNQMSLNWTIWFLSQPEIYGFADLSKVFEQGLIKICDIHSDSDFDKISKYLIPPNDMRNRCNLYVFREGVRPL